MTTNAHTLPEEAEHLPRRRLWFGVFAAAVAWVAHSSTCFIITTQACADGVSDWGPLSGTGVRILLGIITLALLAVAITGGVVSFHNWRELSEQRRLTQAEARGREEFLALIGLFISVSFVIGIIWAGIPLLLMDVCVSAR